MQERIGLSVLWLIWRARVRRSHSFLIDHVRQRLYVARPFPQAFPAHLSDAVKMPGKTFSAKRHRKVVRATIMGVTKPAIRRLARRGGVKRLSAMVYEETRGVLRAFLEDVIRDSVTYMEHARRKTVMPMDVIYALKKRGQTLYM